MTAIVPKIATTQIRNRKASPSERTGFSWTKVNRSLTEGRRRFFECFGEITRAESKPDETNPDFTNAAYLRRFALGVEP